MAHVAGDDPRAVKFHDDFGAADFDFDEVPVAKRPVVAALRRGHAVDGARVLARVELGVFGVFVIEQLDFAHADIRGAALAGVADGQSVVAGFGHAVFRLEGEVGESLFREQHAALAGAADDRAILDLVISDAAVPTVQVFAVEQIAIPVAAAIAQIGVGLFSRDLAEEQIPPADLAAVGLKLNRAAAKERFVPLPEVLQPRAIDDQAVIQVDRDPLADDLDAERVPFAERLVGANQRIASRSATGVVEQTARAEIGAAIPLSARLGVIPDLHLRSRPEIDAAIGERHSLVLDVEFKIAEHLVGRQVGAVPIVDQLAILDTPVLLGVLGVGGEFLFPFLRRQGLQLVRIEVPHAVPTGQILVVEQSTESGRRIRGSRDRRSNSQPTGTLAERTAQRCEQHHAAHDDHHSSPNEHRPCNR